LSTQIGPDTRISMHFSLGMEDGSEIDTTFGKSPADFEFGDGQLPSGFEKYLEGLKAGEAGEWRIPPEHAFGMPNPNNVQEFKRSEFKDDMELSEGLVISFADASQSELPGVVKLVDEERVTIDFNHPLAGETLVFKVEILTVQTLS